MKREDLQNAQQGSGGTENKGESREQQKNQTTNISGQQREEDVRQAGLGRDLMADIEDIEGLRGMDDHAEDDDDLRNEELNSSNDQ